MADDKRSIGQDLPLIVLVSLFLIAPFFFVFVHSWAIFIASLVLMAGGGVVIVVAIGRYYGSGPGVEEDAAPGPEELPAATERTGSDSEATAASS